MLAGKILLILFYFLTPALILYACQKSSVINKIGSIIIAYALGLIIGNLGILPSYASQVNDIVNTATIPIAIPLLLFATNFKSWLHLAGKTFISLLLGIVAVVIVVIGGYFLFYHGTIKELWKISGLLIAVYIGGTANMAAVKLMLNIDPGAYIMTHTYDMVVSSIYLLFLMTFAQRIFLLVLPPFKPTNPNLTENESQMAFESYEGMLTRRKIFPLFKAVGFSLLIFGIGGGLSLLVPVNSRMLVVVLTITTLGILASFIPAVHRIDKTFEAGMYFILVFSLNVASMADIHTLVNISMNLFLYISLSIFGSLLLQVLFSAIFKVDADTVIITSNALINSAPFVPMVAVALKNKEIIVSGITVGIIGYSIGNYMALLVAEFLRAF
jgi:uncharacterized membrane protein